MNHQQAQAQIQIIKQCAKQTIARIKELQFQIQSLKMSNVGTCYSEAEHIFREIEVKEAIVKELIQQKIRFEKWAKKLRYENMEQSMK